MKLWDIQGQTTPSNRTNTQLDTGVTVIPEYCLKKSKSFLGLSKKIGRGGFASVFKGCLLPTRQTVALKILNDRVRVDAHANREARIMHRLQDTGYVPELYGMCKDSTGRNILVMEYLKDYIPLQKLSWTRPNMKRKHQMKLAFKIADALRMFHERGILHNDLKLNNVMVNLTDPNDPKVKIIDFGQATDRGGICFYGNRCFHLAPEVRDGVYSTQASDVYSFGDLIKDMLSRIWLRPSSRDLLGIIEGCTMGDRNVRPSMSEICYCLASLS